MNIGIVRIKGTTATAVDVQPLPAGMIGASIDFVFDDTWDSCNKTYVWKAGDVTKDDTTASGIIPPEVLTVPGQSVQVGVYGVSDGVATPTIWAYLGRVKPGADPSGDESTDPTLPVWAQLEKRVEDLEDGGADITHTGDAVLYTPQTLTAEQKAQARENIGAAQFVPMPIIDTELDATSGNAVANSAVTAAINEAGGQAHSALTGMYLHEDRLTIVEADVAALKENGGGAGGGGNIIVDDALSTTSTNPVQNKVVTEAIGQIVTRGKNIFDPSKVYYSGNGTITGAGVMNEGGTCWIYGDYPLVEGESYTVSKTSGRQLLHFYDADGGYKRGEQILTPGDSNTFMFEAKGSRLRIEAWSDLTLQNYQVELGETATEYEPYCVQLNGDIQVPIVGSGELTTEAKTVIGAVNEVSDKVDKLPNYVDDAVDTGLGRMVSTRKNILDPSKMVRNANGNINGTTGEIIDGTYYVYEPYNLTVGETYTFSKVLGNVWLYFYNEDGTYAGFDVRLVFSAIKNEGTFVADYPVMRVVSSREYADGEIQLEKGSTATAYEPYGFTLNEDIAIPAIGTGELSTEAKTLIGAVNELHDAMSNVPDTPDTPDTEAEQELAADVAEIQKVMPRLNEVITEWTDGIIGGDGTIGEAGEYGYAYSNKVLLLAGETYYVSGLLINHTAYYDLDGNFLGRGSGYAGAIGTTTTDLRTGTIAIGDSDVYAVFQSLPNSRANAYLSRFVDKKASMEINGDMLLNKHLMDKKVLIFGDSITTGDTSEKIHYEKYGGYNKWVEALIESNYFAENNVRNDSIHATGFVSRFQGEDDLISRLRKIKDTDYDLVIVFAGINDSLRANTVEIGFGMDEQGNKQTDITKYFVPAVDTFFAELVEKFVDARICVVLPLRTRSKYAGGNVDAPGTLLIGETSRKETEYADYIKTVAEEYCLPVLDATRHSGFSPRSGSAFANRWVNLWTDPADGAVYPDGVHPNEEYCYKYLAPYIRGFIDGLI